jgi:hypothetical protein
MVHVQAQNYTDKILTTWKKRNRQARRCSLTCQLLVPWFHTTVTL